MCFFLAFIFSVAAHATPRNEIYIVSESSEGVLFGKTVHTFPADLKVDIGGAYWTRMLMTIEARSVDDFSLWLTSEPLKGFATKIYDYVRDLTRELPTNGGLNITHDHWTVSDFQSRYEILELEQDAPGNVTKLAVDFMLYETQRIPQAQLRGSIRMNSELPIPDKVDIALNPDPANANNNVFFQSEGNPPDENVSSADANFYFESHDSDVGETLNLKYGTNYAGPHDGLYTYSAGPGQKIKTGQYIDQFRKECGGFTKKVLDILEVTRDKDGKIVQFAADYTYRDCKDIVRAQGYARYHSTVPLPKVNLPSSVR